MKNTAFRRVCSLAAGVCLAASGIYLIWSRVQFVSNNSGYSIHILNIATWFIYLAFAVLLLIGKKNIGFLIPAGVAILLSGYYLRYFAFGSKTVLSEFLYFVILFAAIMMSVIPPMAKHTRVAKAFCYIVVAFTLYRWIDWILLRGFRHFSLEWVTNFAGYLGYLLMGLWLSITTAVPQKAVQQNAYAAFNPQPAAQGKSDVMGGADKLKIYKELLDSGVITQEEFDAKKKEILGI